MTQSSCFCGAIKLSWDAEPVLNFICHCADDRKITGSMFASNMLIKDDTLVQEVGTSGVKTPLKTFMKIVHSGAEMTSHFCPDCGTTMYRTSSRFPGHTVMKIGTIDDAKVHDVSKPMQEHFSRNRVAWLGPVEGSLVCETDPF